MKESNQVNVLLFLKMLIYLIKTWNTYNRF
jgi:hypothetical protein